MQIYAKTPAGKVITLEVKASDCQVKDSGQRRNSTVACFCREATA